jgi:hypothetical protein
MEIGAPAKDWQGHIGKADNVIVHILHIRQFEGDPVCFLLVVAARAGKVLIDNEQSLGYYSIDLSLRKEYR